MVSKSQYQKKLKGGPFRLARYCMLRWKKGTTFVQVLGQMVQFDTLKCQNFVELF